MLLFHPSTMRILYCIAFDKCSCNCDVEAEASLYITFLIHENSLRSKVMHNEA